MNNATTEDEITMDEGEFMYRGHVYSEICCQCNENPTLLEDGALREYGWCLECVVKEEKRIAPFIRAEHEYVFGDA